MKPIITIEQDVHAAQAFASLALHAQSSTAKGKSSSHQSLVVFSRQPVIAHL
jgi:hypothetical protein